MSGRLARWIAVAALASLTATSVPAPAHGALATYTGSVSAAGVSSAYTKVQVLVSGTLTASLDWDQPTANLVLTLSRRNADGTWTWILTASGQKPETISYPVTAGTWRLGAKAKSGAANYTLTVNTPDGPPDHAYVTLLFSRSEIPPADNCVPNDSNVIRLDTGVAPELARRGMSGTGTVETGVTADHSDGLSPLQVIAGGFLGSTRVAARDVWLVVCLPFAHIRQELERDDPRPTVERDLRLDPRSEGPGHMRGDGYFASPDNAWNNDVQANVVSTCFAFGRKYQSAVATRTGVTTPPYYAVSQQVGGGSCADPSLPCFTLNAPWPYRSPDLIAGMMTNLSPGK